MPLESLSNDQINIHDLTLEQEKKPMPESEKLFEALKNTELYDQTDGYWRDSMFDTGQINKAFKMTYSQLLSVAVEAQFDQRKAKNHYEQLINGPLHDKETGWCWGMNINEPGQEGIAGPNDQSGEFIAQFYLGDPEVGKNFETFKEKYYRKEENIWSENENEEPSDHLYNRLPPILAQSLIDPKLAKEQYDECKKLFYDPEKEKWFETKNDPLSLAIQPKKVYLNHAYFTLFDLLIRVNIGDKTVKESYQKLKASGLFDSNSKMWHSGKNDDGEVWNTYSADDQFLGILCERFLGDNENELQIANPTPSLPETRSY